MLRRPILHPPCPHPIHPRNLKRNPPHHTGLQGAGCLRDLKASGRFRLRTVTRNAQGAAALALAADGGVEVLQGNLLDRPFLDRAMTGVRAAFLATFSDHDGTEVRRRGLCGWVDCAIAVA